ncbi:hypothetical protein DV736_g4195, partial [Chaetothyriales sp. CBS 134916]
MAKKRKTLLFGRSHEVPGTTDAFPELEDDFCASRDHVLVDNGPVSKRRRRLEEEMRELQPSDEEVLPAASDGPNEEDEEEEVTSATDVDDDAEGASQGSSAGDEYWGPSTSDYYNADAIETEADALEEEAEAQRLRQKQLNRMTDADFGFDELQWKADGAPELRTAKASIVEMLPLFQIPKDTTNEERWDIIRARYPEFEPLSRNLLRVHGLYRGYLEEPTKSKVLKIKIRASVAYMVAVVMYISILTLSKKGFPLPPSQLREHPIIDTLLRCQQAWEMARNLVDHIEGGQLESPAINDHPDLTVATEANTSAKEKGKSKQKVKAKANAQRASQSEFDNLGALAPIPSNTFLRNANIVKKAAKSKPVDIVDIVDLFAQANSAPGDDSHDIFGDEDPLTSEDAAEKARKKTSLRFYTNQITQKANTRKMASRLAGGDDDVPYKERRRDKDSRNARETDKKTITLGQHEVSDSGSEGGQTPLVNNEANKYYDSLVSASVQKRSDKRARANAYVEATRQGAQVYEEEQVGPDGKRRITYAIEKNKGLAPKRKKEVRNPRVKKKMRYEQKMKKLGSIKPLYKGGEGKGGYAGELTGIKTNLVKSVKL